MGQKEGEDFQDYHDNYWEVEQARADGYDSVNMEFTYKDESDKKNGILIITTVKKDTETNQQTTTVYKFKYANSNPIELISKNKTITEIEVGPLQKEIETDTK